MNKKFILMIFFCALVFLPTYTFGDNTKNSKPEDEIIVLKKEIRELKLILQKLLQTLPPSQTEKFSQIIKKLEKSLEKKENREVNSDSTRKINRLKQKIEDVKEELKELSGGVQFSGFFDVSVSTYKNNPNIFALGDFELDIEKSFGENFQVAAALVFNDDGAELAVGFIDFHLFGGAIAARGRLFTQKGLHIQIGRYDVPFGNDWQYYASVDRKSITAPLTTEFVMDGGYNDVGLRILRGAVSHNYTLYMLRGIEEGFSFGGRFGLTPFNNPYSLKKKELQQLELGISYIYDQGRDGNREEKALAFDFESAIGPFHLRGEYMKRDNDIDGVYYSGFHISAVMDAGKIIDIPITLFGRYDWFQSELNDVEEKNVLSRITAGLHFDLFEIAVLKFEFHHFLQDNEEFEGNSFFAQIVITF